MTASIQIGRHVIGPGQPVFIVAEGCDNHLGNLAVAMEMVYRRNWRAQTLLNSSTICPMKKCCRIFQCRTTFSSRCMSFLSSTR